jgi:hypothetical protein
VEALQLTGSDKLQLNPEELNTEEPRNQTIQECFPNCLAELQKLNSGYTVPK